MTARPCPHRHGTWRRYGARACHARCSCGACRAAVAAYERDRRAAAAAGHPYLVPAEPVRVQLLAIRAATGASWRAIARRCGVHPYTLTAAITGADRATGHVTQAVADAVAAVAAGLKPARVPPVGSHRRIRALARAGHPLAALSRDYGHSHSFLSDVLGRTSALPADVARLVRRIYDERSALDGPSARTRAHAERRSWPPPEAWTDDTIDDPAANPWDGVRGLRSRDDVDEGRVWLMVHGEWAGPTTLGERAAAMAQLNAWRDPVSGQPYSAEEIAERMGVEERSVVRWRGRLGATG